MTIGVSAPTDPVSAVAAAVNAMFQFLCTPQGQAIVGDLRAVDKVIANDIGALVRWSAKEVAKL